MNAEKPKRSRDEVAEAIRAFSDADWVRVQNAARYYATGRPISPEDLLAESLERAVDGRNCPTHVNVMQFLRGILRSVASGELAKAKTRSKIAAVPKTGEQLHSLPEEADARPNAEEALIESAARTELEARIRKDVLVLFADDEIAREMLEGDMAGFTKEQIKELTGLDDTAYSSKRRLIRRRIGTAFPNGWKP